MQKAPYVTNIITNRVSENTYTVVDRPPYRPRLAPIEYIFCELASELSRRCNREWDIATLRQNIAEICGTLGRDGKFHSTFVHCGYPYG